MILLRKTLFVTLTNLPPHRILKGNLAPGGAVAKITGKEGLGFTGKARTFDSEDDFVKAVESGSVKKGEKTVVILRYLGPKGGPGQLLSSVFLTPLHQKMHWRLFWPWFSVLDFWCPV
jgi:hypothetical protein